MAAAVTEPEVSTTTGVGYTKSYQGWDMSALVGLHIMANSAEEAKEKATRILRKRAEVLTVEVGDPEHRES